MNYPFGANIAFTQNRTNIWCLPSLYISTSIVLSIYCRQENAADHPDNADILKALGLESKPAETS